MQQQHLSAGISPVEMDTRREDAPQQGSGGRSGMTQQPIPWIVIFPAEDKNGRDSLRAACKGNDRIAQLLNYFVYQASTDKKAKTENVEGCNVVKITRKLDDILRYIRVSKKTLISYIQRLNLWKYVFSQPYHQDYDVNVAAIQKAIDTPPAQERRTRVERASQGCKITTLQPSKVVDDVNVVELQSKVVKLQLEVVELQSKVVKLQRYNSSEHASDVASEAQNDASIITESILTNNKREIAFTIVNAAELRPYIEGYGGDDFSAMFATPYPEPDIAMLEACEQETLAMLQAQSTPQADLSTSYAHVDSDTVQSHHIASVSASTNESMATRNGEGENDGHNTTRHSSHSGSLLRDIGNLPLPDTQPAGGHLGRITQDERLQVEAAPPEEQPPHAVQDQFTTAAKMVGATSPPTRETRKPAKTKNGLTLQGQHILDAYQQFKGRKSNPGKPTIEAANGLVDMVQSDEEFLAVLTEIRDDKFLNEKNIARDLDFVYRKYERYRDIVEQKQARKQAHSGSSKLGVSGLPRDVPLTDKPLPVILHRNQPKRGYA